MNGGLTEIACGERSETTRIRCKGSWMNCGMLGTREQRIGVRFESADAMRYEFPRESGRRLRCVYEKSPDFFQARQSAVTASSRFLAAVYSQLGLRRARWLRMYFCASTVPR